MAKETKIRVMNVALVGDIGFYQFQVSENSVNNFKEILFKYGCATMQASDGDEARSLTINRDNVLFVGYHVLENISIEQVKKKMERAGYQEF